jgi:hemerythrin-like domain-containing protein
MSSFAVLESEAPVSFDSRRRDLLRNSLAFGAVGALSVPLLSEQPAQKSGEGGDKEKEPEVTATEDLMLEHGVIRRALLVYFEVAPKLRQNAASVDPAALRQTAQLFRTFGEDYHERMLEEQHIFPLIRKQGKELNRYADILIEQHNRGREVTDYVLAVTKGPKISAAHAEPLAGVLESFVLMYQNHAAREDTIIFPAWKKNFSDKRLDEISDQFEDIEHKMFGKDGFEDAEQKISGVEVVLGFSDLAQFTPPPPPKP